MPIKCAIPNCKNIRNSNNNISFFKFPLSIPQISEQWIAAVNRKNWVPTSSSRVCQLHFKSSDFSNTVGSKVPRLKPDVIPTQNLYNLNTDENTSDIDPDISIIDVRILNKANFFSDTIGHQTTQPDITNLQKTQKREADESTTIKCRKLEDENKKLKTTINFLTQSYEKRLNDQAVMFRTLIEENKSIWKEKLTLEKKKLKLSNRRTNRIKAKLENLIQVSKNPKTVRNET